MNKKRTEIVSVFNNKGGVGKSSITANLCQVLGEKFGKKVLAIDNDPQDTLSFMCNQNIHNNGYTEDKQNGQRTLGSLEEVFLWDGEKPSYSDIKQTIIRPKYIKSVKVQNSMKWVEEERELSFDLLPSIGNDLALGELIYISPNPDIFINKSENKKYARASLKIVVDQIVKYFDYDYIFIDCPPSLGIISTNALVASTSLIIPNTTDMLSSIGIHTIIDNLKELNKFVPEFKIKGILFNEYKDTKYDNELIKDVEEFAKKEGINVFNTKIPLYLPLKKVASEEELPVMKKEASIQKFNNAIISLAEEIISLENTELKTINNTKGE